MIAWLTVDKCLIVSQYILYRPTLLSCRGGYIRDPLVLIISDSDILAKLATGISPVFRKQICIIKNLPEFGKMPLSGVS